MKCKCKRCFEYFKPNAQDLKLILDGEISPPDTCPDCERYIEGLEIIDFEEFSDADPGL